MAWNGTYRVKPKRKPRRRHHQIRKTKKTKRVRFSRRVPRKQRGGQGSTALLDGYLGYPVTGKIPSMEIGDIDSIPTVMTKDDYEELVAEL